MMSYGDEGGDGFGSRLRSNFLVSRPLAWIKRILVFLIITFVGAIIEVFLFGTFTFAEFINTVTFGGVGSDVLQGRRLLIWITSIFGLFHLLLALLFTGLQSIGIPLTFDVQTNVR